MSLYLYQQNRVRAFADIPSWKVPPILWLGKALALGRPPSGLFVYSQADSTCRKLAEEHNLKAVLPILSVFDCHESYNLSVRKKLRASPQVCWANQLMTMMTGGLASGRCSSAFRQAQMGSSQSQPRMIFRTQRHIHESRRGRSRVANQPVFAGAITADRSASQKASENNTGHKPKVLRYYRFSSPVAAGA